MQALTLTNGRLVFQTDRPLPKISQDEALVQVRLAGICGTDLAMTRGYKSGFEGVLGHEFVGDVVDAADRAWVGKRVTATLNIGCQNCVECHAHGPEHCPHRTVVGIQQRDGAFADYLALPLRNLVPIPDEVSDRQAVFAEPLAAACQIREQILLPPTARVAVIGPGRLGLLIAQVMALSGNQVTVCGRREGSLELPGSWGLRTALTEACQSDEFDIVVEATGNPAGFAAALRLVRPRGTLVLKSTFPGETTLDLTKIVVGEVNVVGSRCGPFEPALHLLRQGKVNVESLIDAVYPLEEAESALEHARRSGVRKVLIKPDFDEGR